MIQDDQLYIIVDIETDGPVPGLYSMLSIGAVASDGQEEQGSFYRTLQPLADAAQHPDNMAWWRTQPEAWREATTDAVPAADVMPAFRDWLTGFGKQPVFVAHPIGFDYNFVSWYLWKFTGGNPFADESRHIATLDLISFTAGKTGCAIGEATRDKLPESLKRDMPEHTHNALDDARGYAAILRNVLGSR